jgi:hypothetical protein
VNTRDVLRELAWDCGWPRVDFYRPSAYDIVGTKGEHYTLRPFLSKTPVLRCVIPEGRPYILRFLRRPFLSANFPDVDPWNRVSYTQVFCIDFDLCDPNSVDQLRDFLSEDVGPIRKLSCRILKRVLRG